MKGDDDSRGPRPRRGPVPSTIQRRGAHQYLLYRGPGLVATALVAPLIAQAKASQIQWRSAQRMPV